MRALWTLAGLAGLLAGPALAELESTGPNGFVSRNEARIATPPADAYARLLDVGAWWSPAHTFSGDAGNLSLEARPGGCFCETIGDDGGVVHLTVTYVAPGQALRLTGGLGPLGMSGATGALIWQLEPAGEGTLVTFRYQVHGYFPDGVDDIALAVDTVLGEQLARFAAWVGGERIDLE